MVRHNWVRPWNCHLISQPQTGFLSLHLTGWAGGQNDRISYNISATCSTRAMFDRCQALSSYLLPYQKTQMVVLGRSIFWRGNVLDRSAGYSG